jgi:two-component system chemotaxis sensor kinase CheA
MHTSLPQQDNLQSGRVTSPSSNHAYSVSPQASGDGVLEGNRKKILIVEDEADSLEIFMQMLAQEPGYEVSSAVDGIDALAKVEAEKGTFDLILLDIVMPKMDGIDVLSKIKASPDKYGKPKVIMLTNLGGDMAIETAMKLGATGYLMKVEVEPQQLMDKIKGYLA